MKSSVYLGTFIAVIGFWLVNPVVQAQSFPIAGQILSASTNVAANSNATVFTTPASNDFILTQACGGSSMILSGNAFGLIATMTSGVLCYSFNPGYALPKNEPIQCANPISSASWCSISGVAEKH